MLALTTEDFRNIATGVSALGTFFAIAIGAVIWYFRFIAVPSIDFTADIQVLGKVDGIWIVELTCTIHNKGRFNFNVSRLEFDLFGIKSGDEFNRKIKYNNQLEFPHKIAEGTWLRRQSDYYFVMPDASAKYSHITNVPGDIEYLTLHSWFAYPRPLRDSICKLFAFDQSKHRRRELGHVAERTIALKEQDQDAIETPPPPSPPASA